MCCFPNTGGLHRTSGDAPLETHTLTHNTSLQPRTNCICPCHCCCHRLRPPPPFTIHCEAAAMVAIDGSDSSHPQWKWQLMMVAAMASLLPPSTPMKGWWRSTNHSCTVNNDHQHSRRHHWPKMPLLTMPLCHHPSIPPPPPSIMTAVNEDHH